MFYIYLLYSPSADKFYVGYSDDAYRRLEEHNNSDRNTFTKKYRLWEWVALFECGNERGAAVKMERFIKKQKNRRIFEQMNPAMTILLTHTRMIIIRSMVKNAVKVLLAIYPAFRGSFI